MGIYDDELSRLDQILTDMDTVQQKMADQGLTLGDYDLQTEVGREKTRRDEEARLMQEKQMMQDQMGMTDQQMRQDITEDRLRKDVMGFEEQMGAPTASVGGGTTLTENGGETTQATELISNISPEEWRKLTPEQKTQQRQLQKEHGQRVQRHAERQEALNEKLIELYPDAKQQIEEAKKLKPWDRLDYFEKFKKDYSLTDKQVRNVLGTEDAYKEHLADRGYLLEHMNKMYPGIYEVKGRKEQLGDVLRHGTRAGSLLQYTGDPYDIEEAKSEYERWKYYKK